MNIFDKLKKAAENAPKERQKAVNVNLSDDTTDKKQSAGYQDPYFNCKLSGSNSFLKSFGKESKAPESVYRFGQLSDAFMTEPVLYNHVLVDQKQPTTWEELQIYKQWHALKNSPEARKLLPDAYFEYIDFQHSFKGDEFNPQEYKGRYKGNGFELQRVQSGKIHWREGMPRYKIRGKFDITVGSTIIDLKTTTCQTLKEFKQSAARMMYETQPYIYLNLGKKFKEFIFIGISYTTEDSFQKAKKGNVRLMEAAVEPAKVFIVRWSQMQQMHMKAKRTVNDSIQKVWNSGKYRHQFEDK